MASHQLAIAKASFSAGLLRPDPTSISREDIAHFHSLLNSAIIQCTPRNVQKCKLWILENIVQSTARFTALGKYLIALTTSFVDSDVKLDSATKREPSIKRKRLHLLYLLNDILYHAKYRVNDASICGKVQPILVSLFGGAASFKGCPKHQRKILDLLELWNEKDYYSRDYIEKLREAVKNASEAGEYAEGNISTGDKELTTKATKSAPYVMPAIHGDASTPWFDLPASNLMPHIVPNSTRPINPDMIKPLQFVAGPADERLVVAVKTLLDDVQTIFGGNADPEVKDYWDIDELGQPIIVDEITGDIIDGEGYYGWSRSFCEKMKRRKRGLDMPGQDKARDARSSSRSLSPDVRKRRYSESDNGSSQEGYRSRRRRSYSSSRSPSPDQSGKNGNSRPRSRSRSYSRSPNPQSRSPVRSEPYPAQPRSFPPPQGGPPPKPPVPSMPLPPFQQPFNPNFPPPPPPLHNMPFNGPGQQYGWPPPPPLQNMHFNPTNPQSWPPPPPPPPPGNPPMNYQQQQGNFPPAGPGGWQQGGGGGRGYNGNGWNNGGRGGRGGYRGRGW